MAFIPAGLFQLALALPALKVKEEAFRAALDRIGFAYDLPDYAGVRTVAQQAQLVQWRDEAVARGEPWYDVAPPGHSFHDYGAAFDIKLTRPANPAESDYATAAEVGVSVGLRPGYFFHKPDEFHFELDISLDEAKAQFTTHAVQVGGIGGAGLLVIGFGLWLLFRGLA